MALTDNEKDLLAEAIASGFLSDPEYPVTSALLIEIRTKTDEEVREILDAYKAKLLQDIDAAIAGAQNAISRLQQQRDELTGEGL